MTSTLPAVEAPDLEILVRLEHRDGSPVLTYLLAARELELNLNFREFGPVRLQVEPRQHFEATFKEITELSLRDDESRDQARLRLEAKGAALARALLPDELRRVLRYLVGRARSLEIQSHEAWIPWEVLRLPGEEDGRQVGGPFLCEAFALTRWQPDVGKRLDLPLRNLAVIAPKTSGLGAAAGEVAFLESLDGERRRVRRLEARYRSVIDEMSRGEIDGWHFTGHGTTGAPDPNLWPILLEGGDKLRPEDLSGEAANLGRSRPLVFLNGCHTARGAPSLTHVGGWATQFLQVGAGAFIGASWATRDEPARIFAEVFYRQFLQGAPFGEAVRQARLYVREHFPGDPTWLAFVAFAHPSALCREPREQPSLPGAAPALPPLPVPVPTPNRIAWPAMKKLHLVAGSLIALVILLAVLMTIQVFDSPESEILVRVSDADSVPIQGAEVIYFAKAGVSKAVTGTYGDANLRVALGGRLFVQRPGFKIHEELLQRLPDNNLEVRLRPSEADAGKVLFRIVDAVSGEGVDNAKVLLIQGTDTYQKASDSSGVVGFDVDFEDGKADVRVTVNALDYSFANHLLTLWPDTSQDVVLDRRDQTLRTSSFGSSDARAP